MSEQPSPFPEDGPAYDLSYQASLQYGSAPLLVKLAGIFNLIAAGIDAIWGLCLAGVVILFLTLGTLPARPAPGIGAPPPRAPGAPGAPPTHEEMIIVSVMYGTMGAVSLATAVVKVIAGVKLLRRSRNAWGWGLAVGIVGCVQLWCSVFCFLPMACGIYTIVAMAKENVRRYMRDSMPQTERSFPVE